jgi:uncharacterized protein (DUF1501 family)
MTAERSRGAVGRRDILRLALLSCLASAGAVARSRSATAALPNAPRSTLIVFLRGGIDPVYTTNPRVASEVASGVDVPYGADAITSAGDLRLGPHFAPLAPFAGDMAILNGVQVHTANHPTGEGQVLRLRTGITAEMPSVLDVLAKSRQDQPLGCVTLGDVYLSEFSSGWFGEQTGTGNGTLHLGASSRKGILSVLDETSPEDLALLAKTLRGHAARMMKSASASSTLATTAENLERTAALFTRLPQVPRFRVETWSPDAAQQRHAANLQRALWLFENGLTKSIYLRVEESWDSHIDNAVNQATSSARFIPMFARFLEEAKRRTTSRGTLFDETLVVMGSELGRFPRLNHDGGKDHFPEASYVLFGRCFNTNASKGVALGATGRQMEALPLPARSGPAQADVGRLMQLDDLGATLLYLSGVDPRPYGYGGRILDRLV